jgi:chromosome segregation ATPase
MELDALESKVEKGRIPRRRYKVQKETLRTRLNTLSRTLDEYKEKMRTAGGHYSELMLQLEVAESEIKEVDNALRNDGIRHNQGELSLEAFKKRQDDYRRRKEKVEATINGILLRFREETR